MRHTFQTIKAHLKQCTLALFILTTSSMLMTSCGEVIDDSGASFSHSDRYNPTIYTAEPRYTLNGIFSINTNETVTLINEKGQSIQVQNGDTFAFHNAYIDSEAFSISLLDQSLYQHLDCQLNNNTGVMTSDYTNLVEVDCTLIEDADPRYKVVVHYTKKVSETITISDQSGQNYSLNHNQNYIFLNPNLDSGDAYSIVLGRYSSDIKCSLGSNASGNIQSGNVTVELSCNYINPGNHK